MLSPRILWAYGGRSAGGAVLVRAMPAELVQLADLVELVELVLLAEPGAFDVCGNRAAFGTGVAGGVIP